MTTPTPKGCHSGIRAARILGAKVPQLFDEGSRWRWFYSQQHGDNPTYEVLPAS